MNHTWRSLNTILPTLPEEEVLALLEAEMEGAKRTTIITRLHQRYSLLRMIRERKDLL